MTTPLTERERAVLEAVIETYVQTAEPAGSRTIAKRHQLGLSPATIRNTMSDLEEKGYLYHPHTSAGRIPTDLAYRVYVDYLMRPPAVAPAEAQHLRGELEGQRAAVDRRSSPRSPRSAAGLHGTAAAGARAAQRRGAHDLRGSPGRAGSQRGAESDCGPQRAARRADAQRDPRDARQPAARREHLGAGVVRAAQHLRPGSGRPLRRPDRALERGAGAPRQHPAPGGAARVLDAPAAAGPARGDGAARPAARCADRARRRRTHDHDRSGARRRAALDLHARHVDLSLRAADGRYRCAGTDTHGVRQDRRARPSYVAARGGVARIA